MIQLGLGRIGLGQNKVFFYQSIWYLYRLVIDSFKSSININSISFVLFQHASYPLVSKERPHDLTKEA